METVSQWGTGVLVVGGALLCGLLILIGGILVAVLRSGILGDLLAGLGGTVDGIAEVPEGRSRRLPRTGSARSRARALREQADREFHGQEPESTDALSGSVPGREAPTRTPESRMDAANRARERRRRSEFDDFQDELDAFFDDTEL